MTKELDQISSEIILNEGINDQHHNLEIDKK